MSRHNKSKTGAADADLSQADAFRRVAKELECDEDETRFNERLKRIARERGKKGADEPPRGDQASRAKAKKSPRDDDQAG